MKPITDIIIIIITIILILIVVYGFWIVGRKLNYYFGYESQVEKTIKIMVKPECLKPQA